MSALTRNLLGNEGVAGGEGAEPSPESPKILRYAHPERARKFHCSELLS